MQKDDVIDRQAAIDTVRKAKDKSEAHRMLIQMPPAQPEIIRCKDCKMFYMKKDIFGKVPWCKAWHRGTIETMFCGWGKRKDSSNVRDN